MGTVSVFLTLSTWLRTQRWYVESQKGRGGGGGEEKGWGQGRREAA